MNSTSSFDMAKKRSRTRRLFVMIVAVLVGFPSALFLDIWISSGRLLERQRERVAVGLEKLRTERVVRPSLFEPEVEGNSWDLLKAALPFWKNSHIDPDRKQFYRDQQGRVRGVARDLDRILGSLQPEIEKIRQALRRRHVEPGYDYETASAGVPHLLDAQTAFSVMDGVATHMLSEGRHKEALDSLIICLGLADHLRVKGYALNLAISLSGDRLGIDGLKRLLAAHHLEGSDLARLSRALDILESSWPGPLDFYRAGDLHLRHAVIALTDGGPDAAELRRNWPQPEPGWRQLYSDRILARQLFGILDSRLAWLEEVTRKPVSEWLAAAEAADLRVKETGEPIIAGFGHWNWYLKEWGRIRMRLTLARLATALACFHAERGEYPGTLEELTPKYLPTLMVDPYGRKPFGYWVKDDEATVVSRTRDPEFRNRPVGAMQGPEVDGFPAWRVRRK